MNKYENMEIKNICCEDCLFEELLEKVEKLSEWENITLFAKSSLTEDIIRRFMSIEEFSFGIVDFDNFDNTNEYVLSITNEKEIFCEPARKFIDGESTLFTFLC